MKIHFIGTSHGAAEKGRRCTATLLEIGNSLYVIDCGTSVGEYLKNVDLNFSAIKGVFITHMHTDHCGSLSNLVKLFSVYNRGNNLPIFLPEESAIDAFIAWSKALHLPQSSNDVNYMKSTVGLFFQDENLKVSGVKTDHIHGFDTYGYIIEAEGKRLLFTGDLTADIHDFPEIAFREHFDAVITELTHFAGKTLAAEILPKANTDLLLFNHIFPGNEKWIEGYREQFKYPIKVTKDNDVIEI